MERSTWWGIIHLHEPTAFLTQRRTDALEQRVRLDPIQQHLIYATYMSQMVGFLHG